MLAEYKRNTNIGIGVGFLLQLAARTMPPESGGLAAFLSVLGFVLFIWGCCSYAKGKGHSGWWGLLGLLWILGLIILFFLPDRHKE